ncbi:PREDICTED: uncharacterized protein LOC106789167 isoform X1 [Polistes canadensis]|uniref:uncharacterized protein LOC106789167 isoform X1 n=2 Tax=Polistes canadensis TaxID=91411 RepID=UPI000718B83C|nr:PREDICTED: uncharacterized protein LOC106789167 isoform X1 [Polistes canadensis]
MGDKEHHVHFSGASGLGKDNNIMIQPQRHGHIDVHLGFLQLHHRYHLEFSIPWNICVHGELFAPAVVASNQHNPDCHIIELMQEKDGLKLKIELLAYKERILKEEVEVMCCKSGTPLKILLNARVLGKDKGTPLLRNGIRSVAVEGVEKDDTSD